jgi:hypothetical protein
VLKGFPEQLVNAESVKLLPEMLRPFFSLAQKISEFHRESQVIPLPEFNVAGQEYLFVKERIPELTEYVEACQRLQPELSGLFPVSIDHRTDPVWWLFDFRSRVQERLRELSLDATADEKASAPAVGSEEDSVSHASSHSLSSTEAASAQHALTPVPSTHTDSARLEEGKPDAELATGSVQEANKEQNNNDEYYCAEFSWKRIEGGFCLCGVVVKLNSDLQEKVLLRLCIADKPLSAIDLAKSEGDVGASEVDGFRTFLNRIRDLLRLAFDTREDPIPNGRRNQRGKWRLNRKLLVQRAKDLRKAK